MSTGYTREWPPLLDVIKHVQRVRALSFNEACRELSPALYEGKVKARFAGVRYETFQDDGVEPSEWYRATLFLDGSVKFARTLLTPPVVDMPRHQIEVCWADVLRFWPEPNVPATKRRKPTAAELDAWMMQHVSRGTKRDDAISACRRETAATVRDAAAAHKRLPDDRKLKRGQRAGLPKIGQ